MFVCIPLLFQFLWTKHPSWQKSYVYKCSVYHVHSYPILVFFLSLRFKNHASQMSPYRITSVTCRCRRELCVVCLAPATTSSTSTELLHRQKHPPNQTSRLLTIFCRLRSPSLPPTTTSASTASATNLMMLRSTRLWQRGCTLVASLITIHSRRSIRDILVQRKNIAIGNFPMALYYSIIHAFFWKEWSKTSTWTYFSKSYAWKQDQVH